MIASRAVRAAVFGATTLAAVVARAQPAQPAQPAEPSAEAQEVARRLFREGVEAAQAERWDVARERFARAAQLRDAPLIRFNLALASRNTGRLVEAIDQYRHFLQDPQSRTEPERLAAAQQELAVLEPRLARLRVTVTGDTPRAFTLDGRAQQVALLGEDIPVDPGPHTIDVVGETGDHQVREGALYEGERSLVEVALTRRSPNALPATPRSQSFGHWVTRPSTNGRWVDWAAQGAAERSTVWSRRPWSFGVMGALGSPAGVAAVSVRYFPQPWAGVEVQLGAIGAWGPSAGVFGHLRIPFTSSALGLMVGPWVSAASLSFVCTGSQCQQEPSRIDRTVTSVNLAVGVTYELRVAEHWSLRAALGARVLVNPATVRVAADRTIYGPSGCATAPTLSWEVGACDAYNGSTAATAGAFVTLDLAYGL